MLGEMIYPDLPKPKSIGDTPAAVVIGWIGITVFLLLTGGWAALLCSVGPASTDAAPIFYLVAFSPLGAVILGMIGGRRG